MLTVILNILGILGILLLVILGVFLLSILLILFVPVTYKVEADRQALTGDMHISAKAGWLLGFLRMRYIYPEPGNVTIKILFFTIFDSNKDSEKQSKTQKATKKTAKSYGKANKEDNKENNKENNNKTDISKNKKEEYKKEYAEMREDASGKDIEYSQRNISSADKEGHQNKFKEDNTDNKKADKSEQEDKINNPFKKIYYTLQKLCDKIKDIRDNSNHYKEILFCDDTKELLNHAFMRLGKILKSIRPRKLRADIRFGTGSPDTTGYIFGIYGMLCAYLGKHVLLTPDFNRAVLEGELYASGYITIFKLLWHGLWLLADKKLRKFVDKFNA